MQPCCGFFAFIPLRILNSATHYSCPLPGMLPPLGSTSLPPLSEDLLRSGQAQKSRLRSDLRTPQMTCSGAKERAQVRAPCGSSWAPIRADLGV